MRKKKILSIVMSVIMILAMVPSVAFAAADNQYGIRAYSATAKDLADYEPLDTTFPDGKTEPDKTAIYDELIDKGLIEKDATEDELVLTYYNGDDGNVKKMLKGNGTEYKFTKSSLKLGYIAMKYEVVEPEFDGTVSFNVYLEGDKETPAVTINKDFKDGEAYEDVMPTADEIIDALADEGIEPAAGHSFEVLTDWFGDGAWLYKKEEGSVFDVSEKAKNEINLHTLVKEVANEVTASFDFDGGKINGNTEWDDIEEYAGYTLNLPYSTEIKKDGYTFLGWSANGSEDYIEGGEYVLTEDTHFVAIWAEVTHTVSFEAGTLSEDKSTFTPIDSVTYEDEIVADGKTVKTTAQEVEGYTFNDWYVEYTDGKYYTVEDRSSSKLNELAIYSDSTFFAVYDKVINNYTVAFDFNGGTYTDNNITSWAPVQVTEGAQVVLPKADDMKLAGHKFAGWDVLDANDEVIDTVDATADRNYTVTENVKFVAKWDEVNYTVSFKACTFDGHKFDAIDGASYDDEIVLEGGNIATTAKEIEGYTFKAWWVEDGESFKSVNDVFGVADIADAVITGDVTLIAQYDKVINYYTVSYDFAGGTFNNLTGWDDVETEEGKNAVLPKAESMVRDGYEFKGWDVLDSNGDVIETIGTDVEEYTVTEDVTFSAKWEQITFTVSFKAYDKIDKKFINADYDDEIVPVNEAITTTAKEISGYTFAGVWRVLNEDGTISNEVFDVTTPITADITLVPVYSRIIVKHAVTVDLNGGTIDTELPTEIENGFALDELGTPVKTNRVFNGWYLVDAQGNVADEAYDFTTPVTEDITLKALYDIKVEYNIYKDTFSGNLITAQKVVMLPEDADVEAYLDEVFAENVTATDYDKVYKWYSRKVWVENYNSGFDARIAAFENGAETIDFGKLDSIEYSADKGFRVFAMLVTDANAVTITFDNVLYGDAVEPMKIVKGSALGDVAVENVTDGYQLEGWYNGATKVAADTTFDADTTLKAKWNVLVTFNTYKNGDFTTPDVTTEWVAVKINGGEGKFTTEAPTYGWYTKADWDKVAAGEDMTFDDIKDNEINAEKGNNVVTAPVTYYGMETEEVNVTFSAGTGVKAENIPDGGKVVYGTTLGKVLEGTDTPVREKYQFVCWTVDGNDVDDTYVINADTTFVAKWEARDIVVNFELVNSNEGSDAVIEEIDSQTIKYGEKAAEPTVTINSTDYRIDGWYADEACTEKVDFAEKTFTDDATTLYAKVLTKVTLNVYTDTNSLKPQVAERFEAIESKLDLKAIAETYRNNGKAFYGWFTPEMWANIQKGADYTLDNAETVAEIEVTEPVEFYGKVSEGYKVTFSAGEGVIAKNMPADQTVNYGKTATEPTEPPTRTGYTFEGWAFDFTSPIYNDTVITAKWTLNTYTITYDPNGGVFVDGANSTRTISYGSEYGKLIDETQISRDGAKFLGWTTVKDDATTLVKAQDKYLVEDDTTLYALWEITGVTVTYVTNGGKVADLDDNVLTDTKGNELSNEKLPYGTKVNDARKAVKDDLKFEGWYLDAELTEAYDNAPLTGSITLYAKYYAEVTFQIYENDNYAAVIAEKTFDVDEFDTVELPTAEDLGVVLGATDEFLGWYTVDEFGKVQAGQTAVTIENVTATAEVTYCAKVLRHYTVTFNTNGGTDVDAQDVAYKGLATVPEEPTKVGHVFAGWYADETLTTEFDFTTPITADTTVYAKWDRAVVTITFNMDMEWMGLTSTTTPVDIYYGDVVPADAVPDTTVPGYTFDGWYLNGVAFDVATTPVTENITLDAAWHLNQFDAEIVGEYTYTGKGITPEIKVTDSRTNEAVDLTANPVDVTYEAVSGNAKLDAAGLPLNAGTYKVTVAQKYAYPAYESYKYVKAEPVELTLEVKAADITDAGRFNVVLVNSDGETAYDPANLVKINFTGSEILLDGTTEEGYKLYIYDSVAAGVLDYSIPDYTTVYADNVNAGTATVTVAGAGNYTGTLDVKFEIAKLQINIGPYMVIIDPESYEYDGTAKQPNVTVKKDANSPALVYGKDFTVGYMPVDDAELTDNLPVNVGTYKVVIEGLGNYEGTTNSEPDFSITPKSIKKVDVDFVKEWDYTGEAIEPEVTVKDGDKVLVEGVDYKVSYENNVDASEEAIVRIDGLGNYNDNRKIKFTINKVQIDISGYYAEINPDTVVYNGEAQQPAVTVKKAARSIGNLEFGTEFTVGYMLNGVPVTAPVEVGVYTVVIEGVGNFTGQIASVPDFTIVPKSVTSEDVTVTLDPTSKVYTGSEITVDVTVKDGDKVLVEGTDYIVEYVNNVNVGTATVKVTGLGNYKDVKEATFEITPMDITNFTASIEPESKTYGDSVKPEVTVKDNSSNALTEGKDYEVSYVIDGNEVEEPVNAGTYTVVIKGIGNYTGTVDTDLTFTINQKEITADMVTVEEDEIESTGEAIEPAVTVKDGDKVLVEGTDYTVEYKDNVEPGIATVTVKGIGNYTGSVDKTFTITSRYYYVTGVVRYSSGRVVKYAKITLTGTDYLGNKVTKTTKTDKYGKYTFNNLKKGTYVVTYRNESKEALLNEQD